jgi:4-amino-4-deoxy-L-arabinose transferase-like glycosyltransferase
LPFFIIASLIVALWAKKCGGIAASLLSTLLFTTLPPILAHSGVATLDMACTAFVGAALYSLTLWLTRPTLSHSFLLGISIGLAILSKLSALGFLLVAGGLTVAIFRFGSYKKRFIENASFPEFRRWFSSSVIVLLLCTLTIWAGYRFSVNPSVRSENRPHEKVDHIVGTEGVFHDIAYFILENTPIPAPEFVKGIDDFHDRNKQGHLAYLMGDIRRDGWWYFFPIVLLVKSPLPFILLSVIGFFFVFRNIFRSNANIEWLQLSVPAIAFVGILAFSTLSSVNNGLRQILSVYPLLAIVAGYGAIRLMSQNKRSQLVGLGLVTVLLSWHLISSFTAHPDYLAYFNELAGNHPEEIVVDSDLDWGQDLKRLALTLKNRGIKELKIKYNGSMGIDLARFNLPPRDMLLPYQREAGWIAISIATLKLGTGNAPYDQFSWLREYQPVEQVGKSISLYYIPNN